MSSGKLDQSLDEIMKDGGSRPRGRGPRRSQPRRAAAGTKAKTAAPAGGVAKSTKPLKKAPNGTAINAPTTGDSKIIVTGLPEDVDETQIKDYFAQTVGPVRKAMLTYGPSGRSRGVATIVFNQAGSAAKAAEKLNGVKVDNRSIKIEVVLGARSIVNGPSKTLGDRIAAQPKNAAKQKTKAKTANGKPVANGTAKPAQAGKKNSGRAGRPKRKTAEELDAEMQDYFGGDANGTATTVQATTNDTNMDVIT